MNIAEMRAIQITDDAHFTRKILARSPEQDRPFWQKVAVNITRMAFVVPATLTAVALYTSAKIIYSDDDTDITAIITSVGAGLTFIISYAQWRLARHEASFEKFYERISIVNQYINEVGLAEAPDQNAKLDHIKNMRVFAQLDNLEYVLAKYNLNSANFDLVDRSIRTFQSECRLPWFKEKVFHWIGLEEGKQVTLGYRLATRTIAREIAAHTP